ncbi:unnamed protein product [Diamesa hyperborea]
MTMCVGHQLKKDNDPYGDSVDEGKSVNNKNNDLIDDSTKYYDKDTRTNIQHKKLEMDTNVRGQTTKSNNINPIDIMDPSQSQSTTISSSELSSVVPTTSTTTTTSNSTRPRTGSTKSINNTTGTVLPAKSIDMTNETLLLTNESSLSKMELVSESLISNAIIMNSSTNNNNNNNNHNHSLGVNHIHSKNTKQRTNSNSLVKTIQSNASGGGGGGVRISGQKIEMPVLNDFFDHSIYLKNHEHGFRYGPHFETGNVTNITVQVGNTFYLHCRISLLQDKTVSWVRRKNGENGLELLTVGKQTYSGDPRYSVDFQYPNNWRLKIVSAQKIDEATYECQISTHPPRIIQYNVHVNAPTIFIVDEHGIPLLDKYYEVDSTIQLTCIVRHISMMSSVVFWIHGEAILNYDVTRGGIGVKTDLMEIGANSTLFVAKVNKTDSGNYTCSIGEAQFYTVLVHVLNEESLAELHHSSCSTINKPNYWSSINCTTLIHQTMTALLIYFVLQHYPVR